MIIMSMFVNREEERKKLNEIYSSKKAELVLLYGRRRVGKSRLLIESIKDRNAIYFLADASENILDILSTQVKKEFVKFSTWEDSFEFILKSNYEIFVIDEFQYLYQINKAWPTILQRWWEKLKETKKKIILSGSIISTINKIARGYGSALYGRKTYEIEIKALKFEHIRGFLKYSTEDLIRTYCILGGIPRYLEEFNSELTVEENIYKKILDKNSFLYNEPTNLLFEEFRDFSTYLSVLLSISEGKIKFNEIVDYAKITSNKLPKYLMTLERVGIIRKEIPITERKLKSKITRYFINDNFYRFWLKFIFKEKSQIEQGLESEVFNNIKKDINSYFGLSFEEICKEILITKQKGISKIGRWWYKDNEIDIVALNERENILYTAECKWQDNVSINNIVTDLQEKTKKINWKNKERVEKFIIFAKSFKNKQKLNNVVLFDLTDIKEYLQQ